MWKAYYRRQPVRLFGLLVLALREQARVSWLRALRASLLLTRAAAGFARAGGDYERFAPDIGRAYRLLGLPDAVDADEVGRRELRWWVVRREIGVTAGEAAGAAITDLYAAIYELPQRTRRRGGAGCAASRPRSATVARPTTRMVPRGEGSAYWPEVAHLLDGVLPPLARRSGSCGRAGRRGCEPQRSSGRRPMSHHAAGKIPAATASLATSQTRNFVMPPATASRPRQARRRLQPRHADRVDDRGPDGHRGERPADAPVPAELRQPPDHGRGDHEADQVAAGRALDDREPGPVLRVHGHADRPDREIEQEGRRAAPEPEGAADDQDTEGLAGERHGLSSG